MKARADIARNLISKFGLKGEDIKPFLKSERSAIWWMLNRPRLYELFELYEKTGTTSPK